MALSGNKGEWSEIYTLFKLLGDGKVHAGDADMNKMDLYYPIINIIREEAKKYEYKPDIEQHIVVIDEDGQEFARISMDKFIEKSGQLLDHIKNSKGSAFSIEDTEDFMHEVGCFKLKAPSVDKSDIHIVIHDLRTNMTPLLGFSIKSQLGTPSTLLNASQATNITYEVIGANLNDMEINTINSIDEHLKRMQAIADKGCAIKYHQVENGTFRNNLLFLDSSMPQLIAECLAADNFPESSSNVNSHIKHAVELVAKRNPFGFTGSNVNEFYAHKMKVLLLDAALGMTPAKEWTGRYDANGGYLVVRKDGEIVCYHFYNRNDVEDYLYNNTRFERASRKRYGYGYLYQKDGKTFIKLNLQIRFKK